MKDNEIEDFLNKTGELKYPIIPFDFNDFKNKEPNEDLLEYYTERMNFDLLENDLKLIKLVDDLQGFHFYSLTSKAREILNNGGWLKYIKSKREKEERVIKKEISELKISEFQSKYPRLPYFISFGGVIISFVSLVISCNPENKPSQDKIYIKEYIMKDTIYETYLKTDTIYKKP